jgi:hypothetical protein
VSLPDFAQHGESYAFRDFTLDLAAERLVRGIAEIKLRPKSFQMLRYLVERHGRRVTREELLPGVGRRRGHGRIHHQMHRRNPQGSAGRFPGDHPNRDPARIPLIINNFGGTLGSPIVRDKLFFFGSYEALRERGTFSSIVTVPTAEQRTGNFYDPATGNADGSGRTLFPNNTIPVRPPRSFTFSSARGGVLDRNSARHCQA